MGVGPKPTEPDNLCRPPTSADGANCRNGWKASISADSVAHCAKCSDDGHARRTALTILTAPNGKPWRATPKATYFQHHWRAATLAAGLDGLHFHDLRGTTCTLLAEAGCTPSEIAAMLGWKLTNVNQMLDIYQSMTASLSDSAVAKLERKAL
ncbi:tyrosine-type recombinase/integrase [Sphingomonas sp.]|uniref:tyrosine-type recombinase/integrase n=1 Tax=Sphingomonas sp. TaxID=28214 RepID=UPI0034380365